MKLEKEQKHVIRECLKFHKNLTTIGGWAGCGKSVVVSHLSQALPNFSVCAFTGKAADVLRRKGVSEASTIHSLIYIPCLDADRNVYFTLSNDLGCDGIIVDEASMISKEIYDDLCYFGKPIIFVGDHGQLEPIGDKFNLMKQPDYTLEKIHRNSGEVAHFAEFIRNGYRPGAWKHRNPGKKIKFISKYDYANYIHNVDQIICAFNKTRVEINKKARKQLGRGTKLEENDRVMCLRNNHPLGLFNGMQGTASEIKGRQMTFNAQNKSIRVFYDKKIFNKIKYEFDLDQNELNPFDYCWGITCHKAQGDEWNRGLVIEQRCDLWQHSRWAYAAASRFKELIWAE